MENLTVEQQIAFREVRSALYERLKNLKFTPEMLDGLSVFHLVNLVQLMVGHANYCPMFSPTIWTLQQIFGDAVWDKPLKPEAKTEPTGEGQKEVIH